MAHSKGSNSMYEDHDKGLHETERDTKQTIDLTPSWQAAANIIALALESGTPQGKVMARHELKGMADLLTEFAKIQDSGILAGNVIHIAQIYGKNLCDDLLNWLKHKAAFKDTDRTLNEFLVPTSVLTHAVANFERYKDKTAFNEATNLWANFDDLDIQYLHITFA